MNRGTTFSWKAFKEVKLEISSSTNCLCCQPFDPKDARCIFVYLMWWNAGQKVTYRFRHYCIAQIIPEPFSCSTVHDPVELAVVGFHEVVYLVSNSLCRVTQCPEYTFPLPAALFPKCILIPCTTPSKQHTTCLSHQLSSSRRRLNFRWMNSPEVQHKQNQRSCGWI